MSQDTPPAERLRWHAVKKPANVPVLKVHNSLTDSVDEFVPQDPAQKAVAWYICGPTVYDSAHLGHARSFVTFDIIRRILEDYFNYDVFYVMNITDIDDKIILRARRNHLLNEFLGSVQESLDFGPAALVSVSEATAKAFALAIPKMQAKVAEAAANLETAAPKDRDDALNRHKEAEFKLQNVLDAQAEAEALFLSFLSSPDESSGPFSATPFSAAVEKLMPHIKDVLSEMLDAEKGSTVADPEIFRKHAAYYELEFMEDMRALGVKDATVLTRVTEYLDQIVEYVQKIIDNGFAYESNGSVYFDTRKYDEKHVYVKLAPQCKGNQELLAEGEGAISGGSGSSDKRSSADFALWKKSKPGEPSWSSPWGDGRPGWHIECSVMASDHLGATFDIHSGGEDLKFPHHDNELAQAEAHYDHHQWVNYFFHAGHLGIAGLKMSKSLKNFITIRSVLSRNSARQIRLLFLMAGWDQGISYSEDSLREAVSKEKTFNEFFLNLEAEQRNLPAVSAGPLFWDDADRALFAKLSETKTAVHAALCNNFDYPSTIHDMAALVNAANVYRKETSNPKYQLLNSVAEYIQKTLGVYGVSFGSSGGAAGSGSEEATVHEVMDKFVAFRHAVRMQAQEAGDSSVLDLCDHVRDHELIDLGIRVEDKKDKSIWKLDDKDQLRRERHQKHVAQLDKLERRLIKDSKSYERILVASKPVEERLRDDGFTEFDPETGAPTAKDGEPLSKGSAKKAAKALSKYTSDYQKHLEALEANSAYLEDQGAALDALRSQIDKLRRELESEES